MGIRTPRVDEPEGDAVSEVGAPEVDIPDVEQLSPEHARCQGQGVELFEKGDPLEGLFKLFQEVSEMDQEGKGGRKKAEGILDDLHDPSALYDYHRVHLGCQIDNAITQ